MSEPNLIAEPSSAPAVAHLGTRREFLGLSAAACGAALLFCSAPTFASGSSDVRLLRFLQSVEELQHEFFNLAANSGIVAGLPVPLGNTLHLIAHQDQEHVRWLQFARQKVGEGALESGRSSNAESSRDNFKHHFAAGSFSDPAKLLATALLLKETSVGAWHGAVNRAGSPAMVQAIAALAGVEGRHLAMLREQTGSAPFVAFEAALSAREVEHRLKPLGFVPESL